jgi:hypothetical protein
MNGKLKSKAQQVSYRCNSIWVSETWNAGMTHATLEWQTQPQCFCNKVHCTAQYNKIYHVLLFSIWCYALSVSLNMSF